MRECRDIEGGKLEVVLLFRSDELLYDCGNYSYIEGHLLTEAKPEARHIIQDLCEGGNRNRLWRILSLAHSEVTEMLYPYTKREINETVTEDRLRAGKLWAISMVVPEDFSQTTLNLLENLVHEYLVSLIMEDWLSITHTEKSPVWREKGELLRGRIRNVMTHRRGKHGRVRIRQHPF